MGSFAAVERREAQQRGFPEVVNRLLEGMNPALR